MAAVILGHRYPRRHVRRAVTDAVFNFEGINRDAQEISMRRWIRRALPYVVTALVAAGAGAGVVLAVSDSGSETPQAQPGSAADVGPSPTASSASDDRALRGTVVLDGAVNGCSGDDIVVSVSDGVVDVHTVIVTSTISGYDCVYPFEITVPDGYDCVQLVVDETPVGSYPPGGLVGDGYIGVISAASVWGDPPSGHAEAGDDGTYCESS
jgi:hypothetical protein